MIVAASQASVDAQRACSLISLRQSAFSAVREDVRSSHKHRNSLFACTIDNVNSEGFVLQCEMGTERTADLEIWKSEFAF